MRRVLSAVTMLAAALTVVGPVAGPPAAHATVLPHPRLLFSAADVPALRARITSGTPADAWALLKAKADSYTDPTSPNYLDPALVNNPVDGSQWNYYDGFLGQNQMGSYLTDLGLAYVLSGDAKYGQKAIDLLVALSAHWPAWNGNELGRGDLTKGVGLAFDWTYDLMTPAQRSTIVNSMTAQETTLFSCLYSTFQFDANGFNWDSVCGGGNGLTLLAIEGEAGAPADIATRLDYARRRVHDTFVKQIGSNGDWAEGLNYAGYGLHNALPFAFAWQRLKGEDLTVDSPGIANMARHLAFEQLPGRGERFIPRNDSPITLPLMYEVIPMLFPVSHDGVVGWLWDHTIGAQGDNLLHPQTPYIAQPVAANHTCTTLPDQPGSDALGQCWNNGEAMTILYWKSPAELPRTDPATVGSLSQLYPEHGLVDFRTGFGNGTNDLTVAYEAKFAHPDGHFQEDMGHFSIYGYGADFAVDSGYGHNYSCNAETALYQGGCPTVDGGHSYGHNVPTIDGSHITQQPWGPLNSNPAIREYLDSPDASVVRSDLRAAYAVDVSTVPQADRDLLFSRAPNEPVIVAVTDHLNRDSASHTYQWILHTNLLNPTVLTGPTSFVSTSPAGSTMAGAVAEAAGTPVLSTIPTDNARYGVEDPQLTIASTRLGVSRIDHLGVLALTKPGASAASATALTATGGTVVDVTWTGGEALVASRATAATAVASTQVTTDAAVAKVTLGSAQELLLAAGSSLTVGLVPYVTVTGGPATVSLSGNTIVAKGPVGAAYRVRAPQGVTSVVVNGTPVSFTQSGADVLF